MGERMSLLQEFDENTEIFNPSKNSIDQDAFNLLIDKHGEDFARGYLKAIYEITQVVSNIIVDPVKKTSGGETYRPRFSQAEAYGKLWHLHNALYQFVQNNELPMTKMAKPIIHGTRMQSF